MSQTYTEDIESGLYDFDNPQEPINVIMRKIGYYEEWDEFPILMPVDFAETELTLEVLHESVIHQVLY
jgi:hypothetical protein